MLYVSFVGTAIHESRTVIPPKGTGGFNLTINLELTSAQLVGLTLSCLSDNLETTITAKGTAKVHVAAGLAPKVDLPSYSRKVSCIFI